MFNIILMSKVYSHIPHLLPPYETPTETIQEDIVREYRAQETDQGS